MTDKLALSWLGLSVNAEGLWAIGATIIIVAMVAAVAMALRPRRQVETRKRRLPKNLVSSD